MDEFILEPFFTAGGTCDVLVCKTRGMITDAVWETLKTNGSKLALNYTMTFEMEEIPNARSNRMNYNSHTGTTELQYDDHTHKHVDVNGGVHSKFYTYIFQKNADGLELKSFRYRRPGWYGAFFCCADAQKQAIYVKTDTCHTPFTRISHEKHLKVIFAQQYLALNHEEQRAYFKVDHLRRKIDVQIEDLTFLAGIFDEYIKNYTKGNTIAASTTLEIKRYLAQAWYTYREDDCIRSQSSAGDTALKIQEGKDRIKKKIELFSRVKEKLIPQIMRHNNWTVPLALHLPWHPHEPYDPANLHVESDLPALLSQLSGLSANWTLGDADDDYDTGDKNAPGAKHRSWYERNFNNGAGDASDRAFYKAWWGEFDGTVHNKNGTVSNVGGTGRKGREFYRQGGQNGKNAAAGADGRQGDSALKRKKATFEAGRSTGEIDSDGNDVPDTRTPQEQQDHKAQRKQDNYDSKQKKKNKEVRQQR